MGQTTRSDPKCRDTSFRQRYADFFAKSFLWHGQLSSSWASNVGISSNVKTTSAYTWNKELSRIFVKALGSKARSPRDAWSLVCVFLACRGLCSSSADMPVAYNGAHHVFLRTGIKGLSALITLPFMQVQQNLRRRSLTRRKASSTCSTEHGTWANGTMTGEFQN